MDSPERVRGHLARNLASLRHARALTQDTLAGAAGVPRSTIANLESGVGNPSLTVLVKVANALAVPLDELTAAPRAKVRRWPGAEVATQTRGRGVTLRALVPEPVPEELLPSLFAAEKQWRDRYADRLDSYAWFAAGGGTGIIDVDDAETLAEAIHSHPFSPYSRTEVRPVADADVIARRLEAAGAAARAGSPA